MLLDYGYSIIPSSILTTENIPDIVHMAVFTNGAGRNVLAFKGSSTGSDWIQNGNQFVSGGEKAEKALKPTLDAALGLAHEYGVTMVTGHSLGGYCAEIFATRNRLPGIGFCAPGTVGPEYRMGGRPFDGFLHFNSEHDAAGNFNYPLYTHVQPGVYCQFFSGRVANNPTNIENHSIKNMVKFLQGHLKSITNRNIRLFCAHYGFRENDYGYYLPDIYATVDDGTYTNPDGGKAKRE